MKKTTILCLFFILFSAKCFSDKKEELKHRLEVFKGHFQSVAYSSCEDGCILDSAFMDSIKATASSYGISPNLFPFISTLADDFKKQKDLISVWLLAAITCPYLSKQLLTELKFQMSRFMLGIIRVSSQSSPQTLFTDIADDIIQEVSSGNFSEFIDETHSFIVTQLQPYLQTIFDNTSQTQNVTVPAFFTPTVFGLSAFDGKKQ